VRLAFVTPEVSPYTPGGAGTVVAELARRLAPGHEVTVIVPGAGPIEHHEPFAIECLPGAASIGGRSEAAAAFLAVRTFDLVEFTDFDAPAWDTLIDRRNSGTESSLVAVRVHGPTDLMFEAIGRLPDELVEVVTREAEVYRMADLVLAASPSMAALVLDRYGLDPDRVIVAPPPVVSFEPSQPTPAPNPEVVCFGRLGEVKGSHDLLRSMLPLLEERPDLRLRFVGGDGWSSEASLPMSEWLRSMVPRSLAARVTFEGPVSRDELVGALATAWMVAIPSRFEGYCLAADEARRLGHPLLITDLPGVRDRLGPETGAILVEGGRWAEAVRSLLDDPGLRRRLADAPPPPTGDPLAAYAGPLPAVRHPRSQAGLATAAVQRVEAAGHARQPIESSSRRLMRALLRVMPDPVARAAVRILPRSAKDRFRQVASWPAEQARRRAAERMESIRIQIERSWFPELEHPLVTIVVPCFNQGQYIESAIVSVFEQTMKDWEIVIVDDGSDDPETRAVLDSLDWPRTRVVRQENRGLAAARNAGITAGRGSLVVPLDADDELAPQFLASLSVALAADPGAAYAHCHAVLFGDVEAAWVSRPFNPFLLLHENSVIGCVLLRRAAWQAVGGYDESMRSGNEDWELWVRLLEHGWGQVQVAEPLFRYRKHGISMSVDTESRFEEGRRQVQQRHPQLFHPDRLAELRRLDFPCVSILSVDGHGVTGTTHLSWESVSGSDLEGMVRRAHGRHLIHVSGPVEARPLEAAVDALDSSRRAAVPCGETALWRRWRLLDAAAPLIAPEDLPPGDPLAAIQLDDWSVPPSVLALGLAIQRQEPDPVGCGEVLP
jgi:glycosyltransferase involved in cell wall biosynthesis/GT2 family glycosyltransferase